MVTLQGHTNFKTNCHRRLCINNAYLQTNKQTKSETEKNSINKINGNVVIKCQFIGSVKFDTKKQVRFILNEVESPTKQQLEAPLFKSFTQYLGLEMTFLLHVNNFEYCSYVTPLVSFMKGYLRELEIASKRGTPMYSMD